jgi:hypothetical protein
MSQAEDESYSVIEDNYYQRVYPSLDEHVLDEDQATSEQQQQLPVPA